MLFIANFLSIQVQSGGGGVNLEAVNRILTSRTATFKPDVRYDGMSSIEVTALLQQKEATPSAAY